MAAVQWHKVSYSSCEVGNDYQLKPFLPSTKEMKLVSSVAIAVPWINRNYL
jgi:hypothetical protein